MKGGPIWQWPPAFALRATARQSSRKWLAEPKLRKERRLEASPGIEPGCKDLQSSA
jgi:hypothetical protein